MPNITDFTGEHFTIRISRNEFENKGFSVNEFNGDRFLNMLYQSSDELHEFINIRKNDKLCLFLDTSEVIETDLILALFATTETLNEEIELLERVEQAMHVANVSATYCEEINFLISCMEEVMENAISKVDEIEKDNDVSVPDFIQIGDTCIEKSYITETPAQISYLSMKTDAGKNVAWFYEKTKNLNIDMSSINVFMDKGVFRIIIPCDKLTMDQCIDLVTLATEANIEMCHPLDSLYLLEHKKPMTEEAISFIGETDFTL